MSAARPLESEALTFHELAALAMERNLKLTRACEWLRDQARRRGEPEPNFQLSSVNDPRYFYGLHTLEQVHRDLAD